MATAEHLEDRTARGRHQRGRATGRPVVVGLAVAVPAGLWLMFLLLLFTR